MSEIYHKTYTKLHGRYEPHAYHDHFRWRNENKPIRINGKIQHKKWQRKLWECELTRMLNHMAYLEENDIDNKPDPNGITHEQFLKALESCADRYKQLT